MEAHKYNLSVVVLSLSVLVLILAGCSTNSDINKNVQSLQSSVEETESVSESGFELISSGSTDEGSVSIDLRPIVVTNGRFLVEVLANTHSVDLSPFDLKKQTSLKFNDKVISPVEAPVLSGHHSSGNLVFEVWEEIESLESLGSFEVVISGIPNVEERIFQWR